MRKLLVPLGAAVWIICTSTFVAAQAPDPKAAPTISGNYVYATRTFCQPTIVVDYANDQNGQTFVQGLNLNSPGGTKHEVGSGTFDPSTQTVTYKGVQDSGDTVLLQLSGGLQGQVFTEKNNSGSASYSNTNSTLTINGVTYSATYGKTTKGVASYFAAVGLDGTGCSVEWEFTLK